MVFVVLFSCRQAAAQFCASGKLLELDEDRLGLGVKFDRVFAELAAETRLLVTAEGRDRIKYPVTVDPDRAGLETARECVGAIDVPGPYRRRESVNRVVCLQHRVGFVLEGNPGSDRAKNFLAGYPHAALNVGEDRRPDEIAP